MVLLNRRLCRPCRCPDDPDPECESLGSVVAGLVVPVEDPPVGWVTSLVVEWLALACVVAAVESLPAIRLFAADEAVLHCFDASHLVPTVDCSVLILEPSHPPELVELPESAEEAVELVVALVLGLKNHLERTPQLLLGGLRLVRTAVLLLARLG